MKQQNLNPDLLQGVRIPRAMIETNKAEGKMELIVDDRGIYFRPANGKINSGSIFPLSQEDDEGFSDDKRFTFCS